ncbi:carbohydrate ABC transporter permease [Clostridium sp. CM028]|uniref:carbohydrate ABC transporter permease n=1 Tax=Clostridium TaxID=1485 RepID=UPI0013EE48BE|nr:MULTISPECIES: carbohydrate ABC transporter permease [Clostridium]MBU3093004.1 carbohydrate ABC transporter permease [Clostridium sp. CF011]MBW9146428.1 carbohydrate ABC transporter permease [Clostridium sp. CM027]MBW9149181.1 carbohydrate ABC transporter permease [Clostridium sp. CM028]MBZ9607521.1 carbohydrate ABC transporter permease [Clostridium estertheticum]UVE41936.1 carbohydrate ABC transporter permease [Clostridium sp. CM027]
MLNSKVSKDIYIEKKHINSKVKMSKIITHFILIAWGITTIAPIAWVIMNSFKSSSEIISSALSFPTKFNLDNFKSLGKYSQIDIPRGFFNSLVISGTVVVLVLILGAMAAFVLARFKFFLNGPIMILLVASMLVPQFAVIIPNIKILQFFHFNNTYLAVIVPHTAGFLNFAIIMMTGFMKSLPVELEEAAIIDGCSIPKIFMRIIIPLSTPILATSGIMIFLWSYNDLLLPLVYLTGELRPISVLLTQISSQFNTDYGAMMAALTITIIPVIALYVISQKYVIKGMMAGAVKG